jgi:hypothetical protein
VRYNVAGEYERVGDPKVAMTPGVNGTRIVQQHAVRVGPSDWSRTAMCGYTFGALDRFSPEDWESPMWSGDRCEECIEATLTPA